MSILSTLSVKFKINLNTALLILAITVIVIFSLSQINDIKGKFYTYSKAGVTLDVKTIEINRDMNYVSRLTRSIMLGDNYQKNYDKLVVRIDAIKSHFDGIAKAGAFVDDGGVKRQLDSLVNKSKKSTMTFLVESKKLMETLEGNNTVQTRAAAWKKYKAEFSPLAVSAREDFAKLKKIIEDYQADIYNASSKTVGNATTIIITLSIIILALAIVTSTVISKSITKPLNKLRESIVNIERDSNLTVRTQIRGKDELNQVSTALDSLLAKFHDTLSRIVDAANDVKSSSVTLANSSSTTSDHINSQRLETDLVATAMNEMAATAQEVANNAANTAQGAETSNQQAIDGQSVVGETVTNINSLAGQIDTAAESIDKVSSDSQEIGRILDVISGIAEQTNLLALNAAIEAARAGEQGRGFAVVADEVRSLASRTESSTQEIKVMIDSLQQSSNEAVNIMTQSKEQADLSVQNAQRAGDALAQITSSIASINDMAAQIATAAEEQTSVNEEISKNITNISDISDQTGNEAENTREASHSLSELANQLHHEVNQFKV